MIIGILNKRGRDTTDEVIRVLEELHTEHPGNPEREKLRVCTAKVNVDALQSRDIKAAAAIGYTFRKNNRRIEPQSAKVKNSTLVFTGKIFSPTLNVSATEFFTDRLERNRGTPAKALFDEVEASFALLLVEAERLIAARDPIGIQPLYFGENRDITAFAANQKALWKLGIEKPRSFPPGHFAVATRESFKFESVKTLRYSEQTVSMSMQEAAQTLQRLVEGSVIDRVRGLKEVAVAFSGGLDSSLLAFLAKRSRTNVKLIHVSLQNQHETEEAKQAADELKLPLEVHLFREEDVENTVSKVVEIIEQSNPVMAAVGVPFYWVAEKTAQAGFEALLAGQGADELFGGYHRYVSEYVTHGKEQVSRTMFKDAVRLSEKNIERDMKICGFHEVELRLPFAAYAIADFALSLPLEFKIERRYDSPRKIVLRKVAENIGLAAAITKKNKKAIQYSTGVNDALKKIAKRENVALKEYLNRVFLKATNSNKVALCELK